MDKIADYVARFDQWPIWEKIFWLLPLIGVARLMWMLFEALGDDKKSGWARFWAGTFLLVVTVAAVTFAALLYGTFLERSLT